jgi:hypothetical protein
LLQKAGASLFSEGGFVNKYLITEAMKQELESLLAHHPTQLMELRTLEPDTTIERLTAETKDLNDMYRASEIEVERLKAERDAMQAAYGKADEICDGLLIENAALKESKDGAYLERNQLVALLSKVFPAGKKKTAIEGWSEDWHGCVYIDLPTGQASWHYHDSQAYLFDHLPQYKGAWDGHSTDEKYARIAAIKGEKP